MGVRTLYQPKAVKLTRHAEDQEGRKDHNLPPEIPDCIAAKELSMEQ
jgi:hypothetical protein